jgi:glycosyltransferase involved in cell wall biosynthesis
MRLAINGRFLSQKITGVQRVAREFTRALDSLLVDGLLPGVEARLLVPPNADLHALPLRAISVDVLEGARGHVWEQLVLPRHVGDDWLLNLGNTAPLLSLGLRKRAAVMIHDVSYRLFPSAYALHYRLLHGFMDRVVMHFAQTIFTVSDSERTVLLNFYPAAGQRTFTARNGGWPGDEQAAAGNVQRAQNEYGLYVGSLSRRKNIDGVVRAAIHLARTRGMAFKIVGAPSAILAHIDLNIPADITSLIAFHGQIESVEELAELYRNAAFLLFPSFFEACPLPPVEAMAQNCPVIASDIPSLRERCGGAALYCNPLDETSIIDAVERVLDEHGLANALREEGRRIVDALSWRGQARAIIDILMQRDRSLAALLRTQ